MACCPGPGRGLIIVSIATRSNDEEGSGVRQTTVATQHLCASGKVTVDGRTCGQDSAPVKIGEFSDYQCPFCKRFVDITEPEIEREYIQKGLVQLDSHKHIGLIEEQRDQAAEAGAGGTPSFLINGTLVVGYLPFEKFRLHIEEALGERWQRRAAPAGGFR